MQELIPENMIEKDDRLLNEFKTKLRELLKHYYPHFNNITKLYWIVINLLNEILDKNDKLEILDIYKEEFCHLYIKYAEQNLNPDGFFGKFKIDITKKDEWATTYPKWAQTLLLVSNITDDLLNDRFNALLEACLATKDVKLAGNLLAKAMDVKYRTIKDSGKLKNEYQKSKTILEKTNNIQVEDIEYD